MAEKKVTSYRLSLLTLKRLEELLEDYNQTLVDMAEAAGFKPGKKITRADLLEILIEKEWINTFGDIEKK